MDEIERLYLLRNEIGHELFNIIADDKKAPINIEDVLNTFSIYIKIVRWWVKEIEIPTSPEFSNEDYTESDYQEIESFDAMILREIITKALLGRMSVEEALNMKTQG
ncbi:MAG: hypothetical protein K0R98_1076 [Rickettsiaceae bacterium]|nr:hypothetical protein [Rickettsiaceae bacterium]